MVDSTEGLILLNKPAGITSFRALRQIKDRLGTGKVGHAGTLDPFAEGLLLALAGRVTRLIPLFVSLEKTYEAVFTFGMETDTLDPEGKVTASAAVPAREAIDRALPAFIGSIEQVPPAFSAVHSAGRRAHQVARAGGRPELAPRRVVVRALIPTGWDPPDLRLTIRCSKGTYVRALARDLGRACGSRAYVSRLRRTRIGDFRLEEAVTAAAFEPRRDLVAPQRFLPRLPRVRSVLLPDALVPRVRRGAYLSRQALPVPESAAEEGGAAGAEGGLEKALEAQASARQEPEGAMLALFTRAGELVALVSPQRDRYRYQAVLGGGS